MFLDFPEEKGIVALCFLAHGIHTATVARVIHGQGDFVALVERTVCALRYHLFMDDALIMKAFFGKKAFHPVGIVGSCAVGLIIVIAKQKPHALRMGFDPV